MFLNVAARLRTPGGGGASQASHDRSYSRPGRISRQALARRSLQIATIFLLGLGAAGCGPDRGQAVAACEGEADRFFPDNARDVNGPRSQFLIGCMSAKGFNFYFEATECDSRHPLSSQPECYRSRGVFDWLRGAR